MKFNADEEFVDYETILCLKVRSFSWKGGLPIKDSPMEYEYPRYTLDVPQGACLPFDDTPGGCEMELIKRSDGKWILEVHDPSDGDEWRIPVYEVRTLSDFPPVEDFV